MARSLAERLRCATLPCDLMMRREQVRELHRAGMEIGAHTARHPILASVPAEVAKDEITSGRDELARIIQAPVEVMAYPNGRPTQDYGPEHVEIVRRAGFRGAVTTAPGVARVGDDPFQLPRVNPWDRALPAWAARLFLDQWKTGFAVV
jgi:peptidoglycan/xylan/chitin deacetylase (PgdA/CDA1 family)